MNTSVSSSLIWRGAFAIVIGLITICWPSITVGALLILFAVYVLLDAITQLVLARAGRRAGEEVAGRYLAAVLDVAAAVITLAWPDITALALVVLVGLWAVVGGFVEVVAAFTVATHTAERVLLAAAGVLSVLLGVVLLAHPHAGAFALAVVFGLFALFFGFNALMMGWRLRNLEREGGAPYPGAGTDLGAGTAGRTRHEV